MSTPSPILTQQISSPATSSKPLFPSFEVGQSICYIHNRTDLVPGIIKAINPDETYDLEILFPTQSSKIKWKGKAGQSDFSRDTDIDLVPRIMQRATPIDPRIQVIKVISPLAEVIEDPARGHKQTSIAVWRDSGKKLRVPKLTDFYVTHVGHFFNSSDYFYKITCWRAPVQMRTEVIPEEIRIFPSPSKTPYYKDFRKAFNRYVKEYYSNLEKWNRVEIQALLPEDFISNIEEDSNSVTRLEI